MSVWAGRSESTINAVWRLLVRLVLVGLVLYGLYRLRNIIATLFVAAILAYVLDPMIEWLSRRPGFVHVHTGLTCYTLRIGAALRRLFRPSPAPSESRVQLKRHVLRVYATLYVFVIAVFILWEGVSLVSTPFVTEFRNATSATGKDTIKKNVSDFLLKYDSNAPDWAKSGKLQEQIRNADLSDSVQNIAGQVGEKVLDALKNVVEIVLLPVLAFYFVVDGHKLKREFAALAPRGRRREILRMVSEFNRIMRAYVGGQFILCVLAGVVVGGGLALLRVNYPLILGVLAGITRAIPIIGPIIGGIPIILLTLVNKGVPTALGVLVFFTLLHFIESKFIMPKLIGDRMELHPVVVIVVLLVGGEFGGLMIGGQVGALLGMFFAAPLASLVRLMVRRYWLHIRPGSSTGPRRRDEERSEPAPERALPRAVGKPSARRS